MSFFSKFCPYLILFLNYSLIYLFYDPKYFDISVHQRKELDNSYDFIIIGAGSAGCALAGRLTQANFSVLLLEAGGSDSIQYPLDPIKMSIAVALINNTNYLYNYLGDYEYFDETSKRLTPRGKLIGGTGSINMQIWNKGNKEIYNKWAEFGNDGWDFENVKEYFKRAEETMHIEKQPNYVHKSSQDILESVQKVYGSLEDAHEKESGFGYFSTTMKKGFRHTSCDAYIKPLYKTQNAENLHLRLFSTVSRIIVNPLTKTVTGVEFISTDDISLRDAKKTQINAKYEVILSAGTYNSPSILLRSGIGNATRLKSLDIPVLLDLPGVGMNYQEHYTVPIVYKVTRSDWPSIYMNQGLQNFYDAWKHGKGPFTFNGLDIQGFFKSDFPKYRNISDYHYLCGPVMGLEKMADMPEWYLTESMYSCIIITATPKNSGYVTLASKNLKDDPLIKGVFLKDNKELQALYQAYNYLKKVFETNGVKEYVEEVYPKSHEIRNSIDEFSKYVGKKFYTIFHPVGTCKMANITIDKLAVVDKELKIHGLKGVRVIDGSIMPEISNTNTNAPIIMIAEKGADMIIKEYSKKK